jgi:hypothetical protein
MPRTSTVIWSLVALVLAIFAVLGAVYGPELVRNAKAVLGPIVDIAKSEDRLQQLNAELPFNEPTSRTIDRDRFSVFLAIRRDLLPQYLRWQHIERELERQGQEDWQSAMEVLEAVQTIMNLQIDTLRAHGMSPAEFLWIEDIVYGEWSDAVDDLIETEALRQAVRGAAAESLELVESLEARYGSSAALREMRAHLEEDLDEIEQSSTPVVEGVPSETSKLLWDHRDEIAKLDLASYSELHRILRGSENVEIKIDGSS